MIFLASFAGKSTVPFIDDSIRQLFLGREHGGPGSLLLDAVLCRCAIYQDHDGLRGIAGLVGGRWESYLYILDTELYKQRATI